VRQAHDRDSFLSATSDLFGQAVIFDMNLNTESSGLSLVMDYQRRRHEAGLAPVKLIALSGSADATRAIAAAQPFPVHHRFAKPADHAAMLAS
jgi:ActR/RegA family two-component response regulator